MDLQSFIYFTKGQIYSEKINILTINIFTKRSRIPHFALHITPYFTIPEFMSIRKVMTSNVVTKEQSSQKPLK